MKSMVRNVLNSFIRRLYQNRFDLDYSPPEKASSSITLKSEVSILNMQLPVLKRPQNILLSASKITWFLVLNVLKMYFLPAFELGNI